MSSTVLSPPTAPLSKLSLLAQALHLQRADCARFAAEAGIPWPDDHISDSVYFPAVLGVFLTGVILCMTTTYVSRWVCNGRDRWLHYALLAVMIPCFIVKTCLDIEFVRDVVSRLARVGKAERDG